MADIHDNTASASSEATHAGAESSTPPPARGDDPQLLSPGLSHEHAAQGPRVLLAAVALVALVVLAYWPTLAAEFVRLDDYQYVVYNERVAQPSWGGAAAFVSEVTNPSTVAGYYQPLTMLSLMLDAVMCGPNGLDPFVFHLTNGVLHAMACVLVMLALQRAVGGLMVPLMVAALFAVHPVQAESVAWISQRKTVLASAFAFGCVLCYLWAMRRSGTPVGILAGAGATSANTRPGSALSGLLIAAWVCYVLGTLAKPTVLLLPVALSLLHVWPGGVGGFRSVRRLWPFVVWMLITAWIAWTSQANSTAGLAAPSFTAEGVMARWIGLLCHNFVTYLGNLVWPTALSPYRAVPADLSWNNPALLGAVIVTGVLAVAWITSWRWSRAFFVGFAGFGVMLLPALGGVRFAASIVSDRFLYLPLLFLLLPLAAAMQKLRLAGSYGDGPALASGETGRVPRRGPVIVLAIAILPLLVLLRGQLDVWQDSHALWTHVHNAVPTLAKANYELSVSCVDRGEFDQALSYAERAVEVDRGNSQYLYAFGRALVRVGRTKEAIPLLLRAIEIGLGPAQDWGHISLAEAYLVAGDRPAADEATRRGLDAGLSPAKVYARLGDAAFHFARDFTAAAEYYQRVLDVQPDAVTPRWNRGTALIAAGRDAEALIEYERVIGAYVEQGLDATELQRAADQVRRRISLERAQTTSPPQDEQVRP